MNRISMTALLLGLVITLAPVNGLASEQAIADLMGKMVELYGHEGKTPAESKAIWGQLNKFGEESQATVQFSSVR